MFSRMKFSRVVSLVLLGTAFQVSQAAPTVVSCLTLLDGWATANNLLKVPAGAPATRDKFFKYLGEAGIPVTVHYTDKTGTALVTGAIEFTTQILVTTLPQTAMTTQVKLTPSGPQTVSVPVTNLVTTTAKSPTVQVTTGRGETHVPPTDVIEIHIADGVKIATGANKLNVEKLLHTLLDPAGSHLSSAKKVPTSADAESVLVRYDRNGYAFKLIYFTTASKQGDPLGRKVEVVVFPTEADRTEFDRYLGGSLYRQYFTDF